MYCSGVYEMDYPKIIQGGMGVAVSNYKLARAVSSQGQLGVVSGTMLDTILARRLMDGDPNGDVRRATAQYPDREFSDLIVEAYFQNQGRSSSQLYQLLPMHTLKSSDYLCDVTIVANFVEVLLAQEGHKGKVGINFLTKIDLPTLPSIFGAMLAGVDYILMGAGIPKTIPGIIDKLSKMEPVSLKLDVEGALPEDDFVVQFDPRKYVPNLSSLKRPQFIAIVSSATLAQALIKKSTGTIDGFIVEHHSAGGHNAPPRGGINLDEAGEPVYGPKDEADLEAFRRLGKPFWLAGSYASPEKLEKAIAAGAAGIQVGTAFAFCQESGIRDDVKRRVIENVLSGRANVFTDPVASASGYPFKVVELDETLSEEQVYKARTRVCDLGYLRSAYRRGDGTVGFRCPGEPVASYVSKGGRIEDTVGRKCLCNGLVSTVGYAQERKDGYCEPPLVTAGKDIASIAKLISPGKLSYSARDVLNYLLEDPLPQSQ